MMKRSHRKRTDRDPKRMWVSKQVIPPLIETVKKFVAAGRRRSWGDAQDITLFEGFILPVLRDKVSSCFHSDAMLDKAWMLLVGLIPPLLNGRRPALKPVQFGELAKIYFNWHPRL